jgi:hypothetical protein
MEDYDKRIKGFFTPMDFGNVCVTNTNCEQQIPPQAGFCFLKMCFKIYLNEVIYRSPDHVFIPATKSLIFQQPLSIWPPCP